MSQELSSTVLFVDDEANVLSAYRRVLRRELALETALGGRAALAMLEPHGAGVVVSDLNMPGMDGLTFLKKVKSRWPDTVTIMLTGQADLRVAVDAVNEGSVFRFLTKPCEADVLMGVLKAALEQARLIQAEKTLLQDTLRGAVRSMSEILSLTKPDAFSRGGRMERTVAQLTDYFGLPQKWEFEVAASLSQLGCVTLPQKLLTRVSSGRELIPEERAEYEGHPAHGALMISKIPRLDQVASMIRGHLTDYHDLDQVKLEIGNEPGAEERIVIGAQLLRVAHDYDVLVRRWGGARPAVARMEPELRAYHPEIIKALGSVTCNECWQYVEVGLNELRSGMILQEDILGRGGKTIVGKGQQISPSLIAFIAKVQNFPGYLSQNTVSVALVSKSQD